MTKRHQINSFEFMAWLAEVEGEFPDQYATASRETLYDLWVEGYSAWEVESILG